MSSTSTINGKHRIRQGRQSESEVSGERDEERRRSGDHLTGSKDLDTTEGSTVSRLGKWSSGKVKEELSSLIAEFSYLTDTSNKTPNTDVNSKDQTNVKMPQSFQVFAAERMSSATPFESSHPRVARRKTVDWEDQQRTVVAYSAQADTDCPEEPRRVKSGRRFKHGKSKRLPRMRVKKSRSVRRSTSGDISCPRRMRSKKKVRRRFSNFRASKSRSRKVRRSRSCRSVTPMRRRVRTLPRRRRSRSCSQSTVRDMPFHFRSRSKECRPTKSREIVVKRKKPLVVFKTIEPCAEPTLVTLFPKPVRSRCMKNPQLPCQCTQCKRKLKSLARLCGDPCFDPCASPCSPRYPPIYAPCAPRCLPLSSPCPPICTPGPPCGPCTPKCQIGPRSCSPCSPNWYYNQEAVCNRPFVNQCYMDNCCQPLANNCFKCVYFKFGSTGQCLSSNITQYFHSILDKTACC